MHAYIDESARLTGSGLYVVAAVIVPPALADDAREALRACLPSRQVRFHWSKEQTGLRLRAVRTIADLQLQVVAVTTSPVDHRKTERARRLCLLRLLWELEQRTAIHVTFESRQKRDAADRHVIGGAQRSGHLSTHLRYDFGLPKVECLLWLPDIAAGAVACASGDSNTTYVDVLGDAVSVIDVP